ncbi:phage terminase large subunit family protein [Paracoccus sp. DK608]|uniref:Phage terminase large subunit family protein n=1 Tax=Paracoccus shanxieyensis TaxID=2675752 RepID=A0A6L6J1G4_9RHOB|nr:phage terminase large subunit family protein [Paracoccus shanxieyensis]MTH89869.1 phage terminase large subunit family protein [Paracoccus shanxieyensis]
MSNSKPALTLTGSPILKRTVETALKVLRPPPELTISDWADQNRRLSSEASAEPGQWRTSRAEYQRGIMESISDASTETVVIMSSAQVGKTEVLNNACGYHIDQDPAPIMVVMPTERDAETWSKDRFSPMARDTPCLQGKIADPRSRDGNNKILHKRFPGGHLTIVGANAPSGLASRPIRLLLCDEVDRYPFSAGAEGDPVNLARKRTVTFWNRKIVLVSTPTNKGTSRIEAAFEESDQRRFWVPCPDCGAEQVLTWTQVRWSKAPEGDHRPETARYHCAECDAAWRDETRWAAVSKGHWVAEQPFAGVAGFHLNEIYSPWVRLEAMVRAFLSAHSGGDETMKTFVNTSLGETWVETGEAPDWQRLYDRREAWKPGMVPAGGLFLTAGADVQKDRIEVDVWAWGRGLESWLVDHVVIEGGPDRHDAWSELTALLDKSWPHERGAHLRIARLAIDTGYEAPAVYSWSRAQGFAQVSPVKGVEGFNRSSPVSGPTFVDATEGGKRLRRGARLWTVAVSTFKAETYRFLRLERPTEEEMADGAAFPPGSVHLPTWVESEWLKQFVAEQLVTVRTKRGFARLEWQKLRERNEALDCRVYARAAAWIAGADRWPDEKWRDLEDQLGSAPYGDTDPAGQIHRPGQAPQGKRRSDWLARREGWF